MRDSNLCTKTCLVKKYAPWNLRNDVLPLTGLLPTEEAAQKLYCMPPMAPTSPHLQTGILSHQQRSRIWSFDYRNHPCLKHGIQRLRVQGYSRLIIKQVNGKFTLKEINLVPYRPAVQKLIIIQFKHMLWEHNWHIEALAKLASKIDIPGRDIDVRITKRTLQTTVAELPTAIKDEQDRAYLSCKNLHNHLPIWSQKTWRIS